MNKHLPDALCAKCRTRRPKQDFGRYSNGRRRCICNACYRTPRDAEELFYKSIRDARARLLTQGLMDCTGCKKVKSLNEFPPSNRHVKGSHICLRCNTKRTLARYYSMTVESRRVERKSNWAAMTKNPDTKLRYALRRRMSTALRRVMVDKVESSTHVMDYIGCSADELRAYLEAQFEPGMTWDNHGLHGWHIDHVFPICRFDLTNEADKHKAWHYSNLRPLWARANHVKHARAPRQYQPRLLGITA